jgi:hypothetical protein
MFSDKLLNVLNESKTFTLIIHYINIVSYLWQLKQSLLKPMYKFGRKTYP